MSILSSLSPVNLYLAGAFVIFLIGAGVYFKYEEHRITDLQTQLTTLQIANAAQAKIITTLNSDITQIKSINADLSHKEEVAQNQANQLALKLTKLGTLAKTKPGLVEKAVNDASKARLRCFYLATGGEQKENEVNRVCPQLLVK